MLINIINMPKQMTTTNLYTIQQAYNEQAKDYAEIYNTLCVRSKLDQEAYDEHKFNLQQMEMTIEEYIYRYLGVSKDDTFIKITYNNYPYFLPDGYIHKLIWCSDDLAHEDIAIDVAFKHLKKSTEDDFYLWQAPESSRSVKGIQHFHLIYQI
jgi:hypothetical protein